ncbi:MAG TPA: DUF4232 domain-containing protein [Nitrolancea sp.]|nr:DUF4232 domain-containing protein [Nitrolancea sp.]
MKCERIRRLISDGFERRLTVEERMEVREHVQSCAACATFDRSLHSGLEAIRRLPDITPSPKLWESVHTLSALQPRATPKRVAHQTLGIIGAALTVALVAIVTILLFNNHGATPPNAPTGQAAFAPAATATVTLKIASPSAMSAMNIRSATPTATPEITSAPVATPVTSPAPTTVYVTPTPPTLDAQTAQDTVVAYFHAINLQEYPMAYAYLGADMQRLQPYNDFANGYSDTARDTVTINDISPRQPGELAVSLHLDARQSDGTTLHYNGTYVVAIEGNVPKIIDATVTEEAIGTPVATPSANTTTCLPKELKATASYQGATGSMAGSIIFTYSGSGTCILAGIPEIQIVDANGQVLKTSQIATSLGTSLKPLILESGQQAALPFTWSNWCPAGTLDTSAATPEAAGLLFQVRLSKTSGVITAPVLETDGTPITSVPRCITAQEDSTLSVGGFSRYPDS